MALWIIETEDSLDEMVESIAKAWFEAPCLPEDEFCNPGRHVWETAHEEDKEWGRSHVRFVLNELGFA